MVVIVVGFLWLWRTGQEVGSCSPNRYSLMRAVTPAMGADVGLVFNCVNIGGFGKSLVISLTYGI